MPETTVNSPFSYLSCSVYSPQPPAPTAGIPQELMDSFEVHLKNTPSPASSSASQQPSPAVDSFSLTSQMLFPLSNFQKSLLENLKPIEPEVSPASIGVFAGDALVASPPVKPSEDAEPRLHARLPHHGPEACLRFEGQELGKGTAFIHISSFCRIVPKTRKLSPMWSVCFLARIRSWRPFSASPSRKSSTTSSRSFSITRKNSLEATLDCRGVLSFVPLETINVI